MITQELYIITGSNGAGKSSVGADYLPERIRLLGPVFDGDKLFMDKVREFWRTIESHKECKRLAYAYVTETFDSLVENALINRISFAYEGHFTNEATWDIPRRFREANYAIHLIYLGLEDTGLSELRVIDRTQLGGHYVDPVTIADNFYGNLEMLDKHFRMFNSVTIIDTSEAEHTLLAILNDGKPSHAVPSDMLPGWFRHQLSIITSCISDSEHRFNL